MIDQTIALSIVAATYRRPSAVVQLLADLERQVVREGSFEVVIVNDGSPDDTRAVLERYCQGSALAQAGRLLVLHQKNQGQAAARQTGVEAARGRIILFTDDDMRLPTTDFLENHLTHHRVSTPTVVLGRIAPPPARTAPSAYEEHFERTLDNLYAGFVEGRIRPGGQHFFTGNVSLPKSLFEKVGGFNPQFKSVEDKELGLRIERTGGVRFLFEPAADCHHYSDRNTFESFARRAVANGRFDWKIAELYPERLDCSPAAMLSDGGRFSQVVKSGLRHNRILRFAARSSARITLSAAPRLRMKRLGAAACSLLYNAAYVSGALEAAGGAAALERQLISLKTQTAT